jgi:hypothetical protein
MNTTTAIVLILASAATTRAQVAINPANCHGYEAVSGLMTWEQARVLAAARTFRGVPGHLATITSQQENDFLGNTLGHLDSYAIGGLQVGGPEPAGGWTWITGEPWQYTNWNTGEPNNAFIVNESENCLAWFTGDAPHWNDVAGNISQQVGPDFYTMRGLIVEYDASCCGSADFNCDGDIGTDSDIQAFFACLSGACPGAPCTSTADFNADGDTGTDADIESFFRVLGGGNC